MVLYFIICICLVLTTALIATVYATTKIHDAELEMQNLKGTVAELRRQLSEERTKTDKANKKLHEINKENLNGNQD